MPKIYIASKFSSRHRLLPIKRLLQSKGFEVLSSWIEPNGLDNQVNEDGFGPCAEISQAIAKRDQEEIESCDIFILDALEPLAYNSGGGRETELGIALKHNCYRYRLGPIRNIFHHQISGFNSWSDLIPLLEQLGK